MFLEPDPRRTKNTGKTTGTGMSEFPRLSSQRTIESTRERAQRRSQTRRPLHERSQSQNNQSYPDLALSQPTVRLVKPSLSDPALPADIRDDSSTSEADDGKENWNNTAEDGGASPRLPQQAVVKEARDSEPGFPASSRDFGVSEASPPANSARSVDLAEDRAPGTTLLPNNSQHTLPEPVWYRRSTSSGYYSQCSTLQASEITLAAKGARSHRSSQATTLRATPTPYEEENRARAEALEDISRLGPAHALQTLQEASPERLMTIRPVPDSDTSSPAEPRPGSQPSDSTHSRPQTAPASESPTESEPSPTLRRVPRRVHSTGSIQTLPSTPNFREVSSSPVIETYGTESATISEAAQSLSTSPNFVAYSPSVNSARPTSRTRPLRVETSFDSINSRLQRYSSFTRPETGRSLATHSSWASLESNDTLPPLQIPKKRLRHKAASESLHSQASSTVRGASGSQADDTMADEDIDTLPYPRRPFSGHLSTIASESEGRTVSHHFSHWSYGSGVLTGDEMSSAPLSPLSPIHDNYRRRDSAPAESMVSSIAADNPSPATQTTSLDSPGDMTLGIFREESAVPQPLFRPQAGPSTVNAGKKKYEGPLPPIPPIPKDYENERNDTVSEMTRRSLHQKRSGYSLRSKSTNTHSRQLSEISYVDSEARFSTVSNGTSIFPTWAKRFYSGTAHLSSKISLHSTSTEGNGAAHHQRDPSSWTEHSITSRLGHTYSNAESVSPVSSHFLPAIFRPRTRKKSSDNGRRISKLRKSQKSKRSVKSRPSQDTRPDSMGIFPDPMPTHPQSAEGDEIETLPSGQPRWGNLQGEDGSAGRRPLRKYSKQGQWDNMEFPRPMTKDRLSEFGMHEPHLMPSKRTSQNRLSMWKAPSFTESFDTLVKCRCNRQVLLFVLGFILPLFWMLGAVLPLPKQPPTNGDLEKQIAGSEDDVQAAMMRHEAGDAEHRYQEEKKYLKARWWRMLNRIMSVIGLLLIGAIIALVVIATT